MQAAPKSKPRPHLLALYVRRYIETMAMALGVIVISLGVGVLGYHFIAGLPWIDALLDTSMILGGMGPVSPLQTNAAKVFASVYALFSGLVLIGATGILLAPIFHWVLHRFHLEQLNKR